jgi:hypothetical protein
VPNPRLAQFLAADTGPHTPAIWFRSLLSAALAGIRVSLGQEVSACNQRATETLAAVPPWKSREEELSIVGKGRRAIR